VGLLFIGFAGVGAWKILEKAGAFRAIPAGRVPCTILSSTVEWKQANADPGAAKFQVRFRYVQAGVAYEGTNVWAGYEGSTDFEEAYSLRDQFPVGRNAECLIDSKRPMEAVLMKPRLGGLLALAPLGIFAALGAVSLACGIWDFGGRGLPGGSGKRIELLLLSPFLAVAFFFVAMLSWPLVQTMKAGGWDEVPCEIRWSGVVSAGRRSSRAEAAYSYEYKGRS
jgi:hypothetical protein